MALFFSRISKLSTACRVYNARFFSSLPESPYLLLSDETVGESSEGGRIVNHKLFDPRTEAIVKSREKTLPKELEGEAILGASQGWDREIKLCFLSGAGSGFG
ncbi:unnamed protein product [Arabidopsis arenosa]|uniref:Uncharacterized protein n=1 Tax=Arabidopsis arenosa TaxID=38785 RepID=A0A8S2B8T1_ARAAE|nr:unnamed protein product [Arabidopsis arenosa]